MRRQLLAEAEQDLGLTAAHVGAATPICAVKHARAHVVNVGLAAEMRLPPAQVKARHRSSRDADYQAVTLVRCPNSWRGYRRLPGS